VNERDDVKSLGGTSDFVRHRAEGETVGENEGMVWDLRKHARGIDERRFGRPRKFAVQLADLDYPPERPQGRGDPPVVFVPAGAAVD
jgi:hypothetical protein